jgi:hypothetical protein
VPLDYEGATGQITGVLAALGGNRGGPGGDAMGAGGRWELDGQTGAWMLLPPQTPFAVVHFIGGAGFGTYPRLAYASLLERVVERSGGGLAVVAVPFDAGLAHGKIAAASVATFNDVFSRIAERELWPTATLRTFRLGHSLGAKLHVLNVPAYLASTSPSAAGPAEIGVLAFNNFALQDSISQAVAFLEALGAGGGAMDFGGFQKSLVDFATMAVAASGIEFDPGPEATRTLLAQLSAADAAVTAFRFSDDDLDSSDDLRALGTQSFRAQRRRVSEEGAVEFVELQGGHLTSIFVKVSASDVAANSVAPEIIAPLLDANGAFSFGSEELLDETADAIVAWIVPSKSRSRKPPALSASVE